MNLKEVLDEIVALEVDTKDSARITSGGNKLEQIIMSAIKEAITNSDVKLAEKQKKVLHKIDVKNEEPFDVEVEAAGAIYKVSVNPENGEKKSVASINKTKLETMCTRKDYSGILSLLLKEQF
jgi:hypothetical protein